SIVSYNLELHLRYLDLYNKDARFWSDDEDDEEAGVILSVSKYYVAASACGSLRISMIKGSLRIICT
ncbi:unnamed protein product, partial [Allacma fusca]